MTAPSHREVTKLLDTGIDDAQNKAQIRGRVWGFGRTLAGLALAISLFAVGFLLHARGGRIVSRLRPSASTDEVAIVAGCCTYYTDSNNKCGTCGPNNMKTNGFCAQSKGNCGQCGATSVWCGGEAQNNQAVSHKPTQVKMTQPAGTALKNPFKGKKYYVHPHYAAKYEKSMKGTTGKIRKNLERMKSIGAAYWIDNKAKLHGDGPNTLEGILKDAKSQDPVPLVSLIWYDLPNRDCDAKASIGEICCTVNKTTGHCDLDTESDCEDGLKEYKETYVQPFIRILKKYSKHVPVVVILEPDSLPNLATNLKHPHCGNKATVRAYKEGFAYALNKIVDETPEVTVYLDAASGSWLGWAHQCMKYLDVMVELKLPMHKVRGFATNTAKYQPLGIQCPWEHQAGYSRNNFCLPSSPQANEHKYHKCCKDPCKLLDAWDPGNNEHNYAALLISLATEKFGSDHFRVVIDTGRNGAQNRKDCHNFCNIRKAGAGRASTTETENNTILDAYFWLKTPGESDGCTKHLPNGTKCARYDAVCGSEDSLGNQDDEPKAPEAGEWYDYQVKMLAEYADFDGTGS